MSSSSFATMNDDEKAVTMDVHVMDTLGIEDYIHEIISTLRKSPHDKNDTVDGNWKLTLNEKHRSKMMRAIVGLSKVEFKQRLRELEHQHQWDLADTFVRQQLQALTDKNVVGLFDKAPNFSTAVDQYISSDPSQQQSLSTAAKFFSTMARGRMYQGKMERLLAEVAPHLSDEYSQIVGDLSNQDLLQLFVKEYQACEDGSDDNTSLLLQQCLDIEFVDAPPDSADGGRSKGKRGEVDLFTYLTTKCSRDDSSLRVLAPVWIRPLGSSKRGNTNKCKYVLEVPSKYLRSGITNEYDAMVVRVDDNDCKSLTIMEVWDAKATMDVTAIHDILKKKVFKSLVTLLDSAVLEESMFVLADTNNDNSKNSVYHAQLRQPSSSSHSTNAATTTATITLPNIGLFGSKLPTPQTAARRLQVIVCEVLLEADRGVVEGVLAENSGQMTPPSDIVVGYATELLTLIQQVQPTMVVSNNNVQE